MADFWNDFNSWLANYGTNNGGGSVGQALALGYLPAAVAGGYQNWQNADNISDTAERASQMASPVSLEERQRAQSRLGELYTNPTAFLQKNPEFMASQSLGLDTIQNQLGRLGMANSGNAISDAMKFQTKLSSQYIDQDARRLMEMGGYQFNPAAGAEMLLRGAESEAKYKNEAIDSILSTLGLLGAGNRAGGTQGGSGGTPGGGSPGTGSGTPAGGTPPRTIGGTGTPGASQIPGVAANALMQWMQQNNITNLTPQALQQFLSTLPMGSIDPAYFDVLQGGSAADSFGALTSGQQQALHDLGIQVPQTFDPTSPFYAGDQLINQDPLGLAELGYNTALGTGSQGLDPLQGMYDSIPSFDNITIPDFSTVFDSPALNFDPTEFTFDWFGSN